MGKKPDGRENRLRCQCRTSDTFTGTALDDLAAHLEGTGWHRRCNLTGHHWYIHRDVRGTGEATAWRYPDVQEGDLRDAAWVRRAADQWGAQYRVAGAPRRSFETRERFYSATFSDYLARLQTGEADPEAAIVFLEVDPWVPWSGYWKQRVLRFVSRVPLTDPQRRRLQDVVIDTTRKGPRREFPETMLLAKRIWDADFELRLRTLAAEDPLLEAPVEKLIRKRYTR